MNADPSPTTTNGHEAERLRRRRGRSLAIAAVLVGLVVLFYIITVVQLGIATGGEAPS